MIVFNQSMVEYLLIVLEHGIEKGKRPELAYDPKSDDSTEDREFKIWNIGWKKGYMAAYREMLYLTKQCLTEKPDQEK